MKIVKLWDIIAWLGWLLSGAIRMVAKLVAFIPFTFVDRKTNPIWGIRDWPTDKVPYLEGANPFGNAAHNLFDKPSVPYEELSNSDDFTLEKTPGLQWRLRRSTGAGNYISLRVTWGNPDPEDGKKEFYIGWTMDDKVGRMRPTFQFRPF